MFLISLLTVLVAFYFCTMGSVPSWKMFVDFPSLLILLVIVIPTLIQTGLLKDFNNSFRLTMGKKKTASFKELKRAMEALQLVRKTTWCAALFSVCVSLMSFLSSLSAPEALGPNLAVITLELVYASFINLLLYPMEKQLTVRLLEFDEDELTREEGKADVRDSIKDKDTAKWL